MQLPAFDIEFTRSGEVFSAPQVEALLAAVPELTDLFVVSHGWNNDMADARALYDALFRNVSDILDAGEGVVPGLAGRRFGVLRVFWPSKKFTDEELIPGGGAASATKENDDALIRQLEALKTDPERLGGHDRNPVRDVALTRAQQLVPMLETDASARHEYVMLLRSILNPTDAHADDGSEEFFSRDTEELFAGLKDNVVAPGGTGIGGVSSVHGTPGGTAPGGAAGFKDLLEGVKAAARRLANFTTYYAMKERAGLVGRAALAPVLQRVRDRKSDIRLHLIGHSFGGRLVTAAANSLPPNTPRVSLALLQAAFSHNGLAEKFDEKHDGAFRSIIAQKRVSGPIIITHTKNDKAVGVAYPLASRLSRDQAAALGDANDPYGGMGRNGAQRMKPEECVFGELLAVGKPYELAPGKVFNLKADTFIADHGSVTGLQVAYAILNVARTA